MLHEQRAGLSDRPSPYQSLTMSMDLLLYPLSEDEAKKHVGLASPDWTEARLNGLSSVLVDKQLGDQIQEATTQESTKARLKARLQTAFDSDPLESGLQHPAEMIIAQSLNDDTDQRAFDWVRSFCLGVSAPAFAASVLRCLGRLESPGDAESRRALVREALRLENVEIRDAAAQAADSWSDAGLIGVLQAHVEPEAWLQDYIREILADLQARPDVSRP